MKASEVEVVYKDEVKHISQIITTITFERRSWQLVWQMLFPMLLIVSMIWSIFWIDLESLADRLNISFIGVLTIVAYQFVKELSFIIALAASPSPLLGGSHRNYRLKTIDPCKKVMGMAAAPYIIG